MYGTIFNLKVKNDLKNEVEKDKYEYAETIVEEETLSLLEKEIEMIKRALLRSKGRRKLAAKELGISERTLYRKKIGRASCRERV